jgi:hypothetical protein
MTVQIKKRCPLDRAAVLKEFIYRFYFLWNAPAAAKGRAAPLVPGAGLQNAAER